MLTATEIFLHLDIDSLRQIILEFELSDDDNITHESMRNAYVARDILLYGNDINDHLEHLNLKLNKLRNFHQDIDFELLCDIVRKYDIVKFYNTLTFDQLCLLGY